MSQPLDQIISELIRNAARTGETRRVTLRRGMQLAAAVTDGVVTLTASRRGVRVGDGEIAIIVRQAAIPATALRYPVIGQKQRDTDPDTWFVAWRWPLPVAYSEHERNAS